MEHFRLTVFMTVYSFGSCTEAARHLGLTQPAVSQNISELEKELGIALFVRGTAGTAAKGGKMVPTPAAKVFMQFVRRVLKDYDDIRVLFNPESATYETVRIRADRSASEYVLPRVIDILHAAHPNIRFEVLPPANADAPATDAVEGTAQEPATPADVTITSVPVREGGSLTLRFEVYGPVAPFVEAVRLILTDFCL